jgi:hypothetical protein
MMFLDCPAYLDHDGAARCGLPAEVRCSDHLISAVTSGYQPSDTALPTRRYGPPPALGSRASCARVPGTIGITMRRPRMRNRPALPGSGPAK